HSAKRLAELRCRISQSLPNFEGADRNAVSPMKLDHRVYFDPPSQEPKIKGTLAEKLRLEAAARANKDKVGSSIGSTDKVPVEEAASAGAQAYGKPIISVSKDDAKHYLQKVASLVPVEIVGAYEAATLLVNGVKPEAARIWFYWGLFGLGLLGTLLYFGWRI